MSIDTVATIIISMAASLSIGIGSIIKRTMKADYERRKRAFGQQLDLF
ncbi:MAG: hypothetical protein ABUS47_12060 [Steroidobacter sp.]